MYFLSLLNLFKEKNQESGEWLLVGFFVVCLVWFGLGWVGFLDVEWAFENNRKHQGHFLRVYIALAEEKMASHDS